MLKVRSTSVTVGKTIPCLRYINKHFRPVFFLLFLRIFTHAPLMFFGVFEMFVCG